MLDRVLALQPHLRFERHASSDAAFVVGEREHFSVDGAARAALDALDGVKTLEQVLSECSGFAPPLVVDALVTLEERGIIGPPTERDAGAAFEAGAALAGGARHGVWLNDTTASSRTDQAARDAIVGAGLGLASAPGPGTVTAIIATDYLARECLAACLAEYRARRAVFLLKPTGLRPLIGPLIRPDPRQPCPRCLSHALERQRPVQRLLSRDSPEEGWPSPPLASLPATTASAIHLAAVELRKLLDRRHGDMPTARLWSLDLVDFELRTHEVRRRPQCSECGDETLMARSGARPVTLASVPIGYQADGGLRRDEPAQAYARLRHLVSPLLGPVNHLGPMPERHTDRRRVFVSGYFVAPACGRENSGFDRHCAGKGITLEQARMSALAEAIERLSGVYSGDEAVCQSSLEALGGQGLHPDELHHFSAAQRAERRVAKGRLAIPRPLDPQVPIAWTPGWSLATERRRYLPLAYCFDHSPARNGAEYVQASSNGSAAGSCLEEAILQGLFELIERDATAIWWYNQIPRPTVPIPDVVASYFESLTAEYTSLGWSLWTLDLTHDLGVPVVAAIAVHESSDRFALGLGCHTESSLAVSRALSELNQVVDPDGVAPDPWDGLRASQLAFLRPDRNAPASTPAPAPDSADLRDHIAALVDRLSARGLQTIVVDKTRPDLELSVAQVVVPGLRHIWPQLGPGRLYSVPVTLGWLPTALREDQLNPHPLLI